MHTLSEVTELRPTERAWDLSPVLYRRELGGFPDPFVPRASGSAWVVPDSS